MSLSLKAAILRLSYDQWLVRADLQTTNTEAFKRLILTCMTLPQLRRLISLHVERCGRELKNKAQMIERCLRVGIPPPQFLSTVTVQDHFVRAQFNGSTEYITDAEFHNLHEHTLDFFRATGCAAVPRNYKYASVANGATGAGAAPKAGATCVGAALQAGASGAGAAQLALEATTVCLEAELEARGSGDGAALEADAFAAGDDVVVDGSGTESEAGAVCTEAAHKAVSQSAGAASEDRDVTTVKRLLQGNPSDETDWRHLKRRCAGDIVQAYSDTCASGSMPHQIAAVSSTVASETAAHRHRLRWRHAREAFVEGFKACPEAD